MRTAATRQQRWWSSPERWLPMDLTTRSGTLAVPRVGRLLLVALVILAIAAAAIIVVGLPDAADPAAVRPGQQRGPGLRRRGRHPGVRPGLRRLEPADPGSGGRPRPARVARRNHGPVRSSRRWATEPSAHGRRHRRAQRPAAHGTGRQRRLDRLVDRLEVRLDELRCRLDRGGPDRRPGRHSRPRDLAGRRLGAPGPGGCAMATGRLGADLPGLVTRGQDSACTPSVRTGPANV